MAYAIATAAVLLLYAAAAIANPTRTEGASRINPLLITSGINGRASLSKLQIFFFSLIVIWLLTYFLVANSELSDLSPTVLMLLGVSAAGTVGAKVTSVVRKRLSGENWAWLVHKKWIVESIQRRPRPPRFNELMTSDDDFDVAKFQAVAVSLLVGVAMVYTGIRSNTLADFQVPENVVALLGLSQTIYLGGKVVGPSTVGDLNDKLTKVRQLESTFMSEASRAWQEHPPATADLEAAIRAAPDAYNLYLSAAKEAAVMVQERIGAPSPTTKLQPETPHI